MTSRKDTIDKKRDNKSNNTLTLSKNVQPQTEKVWAKFTYFDERIRILTKIFCKSNIRVAFGANNTIKKICNSSSQVDKYNKSGVYSLKCISCNQNYIGQTGRSFKIRYDEHIRDIRFNKEKSKYASHILQFSHEYGTIDNTMEILKIENKGVRLDVIERYLIYKTNKEKPILNEQHVDVHNILFEILLKHRKEN
jgi:hypothetical protein